MRPAAVTVRATTRPWWACQTAERPPDPYVRWHHAGCVGCLMKARHQADLYPDDPTIARLLQAMGDDPGS